MSHGTDDIGTVGCLDPISRYGFNIHQRQIRLMVTALSRTNDIFEVEMYRNEQRVGDFLNLVRVTGMDDPFAVAVTDRKGRKLGYIPKGKNEVIANLLDANINIYGLIDEALVDDFGTEFEVEVVMNESPYSPGVHGE